MSLFFILITTKTFAQITNPVQPVADLIAICPDDGSETAKIFLCGSTASRTIVTSIVGATFKWELLDQASCPAVTNTDCANKSNTCTWTEKSTNPNFTVSVAGQYRVSITDSSGVPNIFYFNVYQNALDIPITKIDIYCGKPGEIRVAQLTDYEYSLDGSTYQLSNVFPIVTAGKYDVKVRRVGATSSDCVFTIPVTIAAKDLNVTSIVTQPIVSGDKGTIQLTATNVREQYFYKITQGGTFINETGSILDSNYTFPNLNAGTYTWSVKTGDCDWQSGDVTIHSVAPFQISTTVQPVTCQPGSIQVSVTGGTAPYEYFFNGNTIASSSNKIKVPVAGTYSIKVVDSNGQKDTISVIVPDQTAPVYTIEKTNLNCYYPNTWQIKFNVTNANNYSLRYSIDNGLTFSTNPVFSGLSATPAGTTYTTVIEYTYGGVKCTKSEEVTIVQPQFGLSATAGVAELIGCQPSPDEDKAKIRITNPQGGTPPYQYSYDNQLSWETNTTVMKPAGGYVFYIKDTNGCVSALNKVIVENIGVPTITVKNDSFNCDGTANSSITITTATSTNFSYTYSLDGGIFQSSPNFSTISPGNHSVSVKYEPLIVPTYSNLLKEDFGYGADTTSPGMSSVYCFERQVLATQCKGSIVIQDGDYSVTSKIISPYGAWYSPIDDTSPSTPKGRFLAVNVNATLDPKAILYEKTIADIIPNQPIVVELYVTNLLRKTYNATPPNLTIALVNSLGTEISTLNTGDVPRNESWNQYKKDLNPGNNSTLRFIVRNNNPNGGGNDLAIDDISAYQIPKLCAATRVINFTVPSGKAFDANIIATKNASCAGLSNGEITIAAQNYNAATGYQYSKDNGATWQTVMISPFVITNLGAGTYTIKVRYNASATGVCVKSFSPITITAPAPLATTAIVTPLATCSRGATITAISTGGTPFYTYELWDELNTTKIRSAQNSGVFDNVAPGKYTVRGLDANGCGSTTPVPITVLPPPIPNPIPLSISDLCYDAVNQATIQIAVTSGTAPFSYSLDKGALQTSDTFTNVGPGIHTVEVTDANNCKATTQNITIGNELKVAAVLTKALDCSISPNAVIKVTIDGGARPLRYQIKKGTAIITTSDISIPDTDFAFTYSVPEADAGTYSFVLIDANGCSKITNTITIGPKVNPKINTLTEVQSIQCHGNSTAAIKINLDASKGIAPFTYLVKNTTTNTSYGNQFFGLPAGTYEVTVTDSNLCIDNKVISISEPNKISVVSSSVPIKCNSSGISKGSVIVDSVTGGISPYNYFVTGVNNYDAEELNNSGTTSHTFDVVDFGLYQINVVDSNGCSVLIQDVLVASPPEDLDIQVTTTTVDCTTGGTASVAVGNITGSTSTGPFHFSIYRGNTPVYPAGYWQNEDAVGSKKTVFTHLIPGLKYTFIVYDENTGCYHFETAESAIATNSTLEIKNVAIKNISCKGSADGKVSFTIQSNYSIPTPVSYQVYNSQSLLPLVGITGTTNIPANGLITITDVGPLPFGNYIVVLKEETGAQNQSCSVASTPFNITESAKDLVLNVAVLKNVNCNENGIISVQAKDGKAPYQYQISAVSLATSSPIGTGLIPPPPPSPSGVWETSNTFTVNQAGTYTVFVKDAYGCEKFSSVVITKDPEPIIDLSVPDRCVPEGTFTINITATTAGIAPYYLSVNGSVFSPVTLPYNLLNQNSGNYTITIKDVNGCFNTQNQTIFSPLGLSSRVIKQPTCATNDGEIEAIAVGGSGNFQYKIDGGSYTSNFIFSGLSSGGHTIYIKDISTLCEKTISVNLEVPTAVTGLTLSQKLVTCHGGNDGSITATIDIPAAGINDNPVYKYSIDGVNFQDSNLFSGLIAGTYTVAVVSGRGCVASQTNFSVTEPTIISVPTPAIAEFGCNSTNALNNASITVNGVLGGSGIYTQYEFIKNGNRVQFGPNPTYIETDLNGGNYTINVFDDKGCSGSTPAVINPLYVLDAINVNATSPISCSASENITVSVSGIGGTPTNIDYSLRPISGSPIGTTFSSNSSGIFSGLTVGDYLITARNTVTNCTLQEVYTVNEPNTFGLTVDSVVDVTCFGGTNGSVTITLTDQNTPSRAGIFSYAIKDSLGNSIQSATTTSAGPILISGLKADTYSITVTLTNTPFCSVTKNFTISQPTSVFKIGESHSDITCAAGNTDGKITALPSGGWADFYEFKWEKASALLEDWGAISELSNLDAGTYKLHGRDAKGCVVDMQIVLNNPTPITITASSDKSILSCFADRTATVSVTAVSGGQGSNYWYTLNQTSPNIITIGPQTTNSFANVSAGIYTVTVNDNWSCAATSVPIIINEPNNVIATLSLLTAPTCTIAAQLNLQITGGTPPYSFSADNTVFNPFSAALLNGTTGVNHYFVKDTNGCGSYLSNDVVVENPKGLSVTIDTTFAKVNCFGESTASILATAQGGLGNYSYTLLDELNNLVRQAQSAGIFSGLPAGKYKVKVTSSDCVPADSGIIIIDQPAAKLKPTYFLKDALCAGATNGTIKVDSSGGTVVIKQAISPNLSQFVESNLFENLGAGTYDIVVQDALGCYEKTTQKISQPSPIQAVTIASSIVQELCFDDKTAAFSIDISGGILPYSVSLDNPAGPFLTGTATQTQFDFTGLTGGMHTVYIQDGNICTFEWKVNLNESVKLNPVAGINYNCVSNAQHNVVTVNLDSSITDFSLVEFSLDGGVYQSSNQFTNLTPGNHFIRVKHTNGCIKDTPVFNILKIDPLSLSLQQGGLNEIIAVPNGGGGNYNFTFDGEFTGSNPSYIYYKTQPYLVTVQDVNGCTTSTTQLFNYIDICVPNYFTPNGDGLNDTWAPGCTVNYKNLTFAVFDRYGREIGSYRLGESWDGKYKEIELPSGDYWYVLKLNNSKDYREFVGHFTLYR